MKDYEVIRKAFNPKDEDPTTMDLSGIDPNHIVWQNDHSRYYLQKDGSRDKDQHLKNLRQTEVIAQRLGIELLPIPASLAKRISEVEAGTAPKTGRQPQPKVEETPPSDPNQKTLF